MKVKERWIDLSTLIKYDNGQLKGRINWSVNFGSFIKFHYNEIFDNLLLVGYGKNKNTLIIQYNNKNYEIGKGSLTNCQLGRILKYKTSEFKYNIGDKIIDDKRNLLIINKKYIKNKGKYYNYLCENCTYTTGWIRESDLNKRIGCQCCAKSVIVPDINSIVSNQDTLWMIEYFQNGYDEAKKYSPSSNKRKYNSNVHIAEKLKKTKFRYNFYKTHSIGCPCSGHISYPEKFFINFLEQLHIDYIYQATKTNLQWCKRYRYDFYLPEFNCIIETNGAQHYRDTFWGTKENQTQNDTNKRILAEQKWYL